MTSLTRLPVVKGPGVRRRGSPVSEAAGFAGIKGPLWRGLGQPQNTTKSVILTTKILVGEAGGMEIKTAILRPSSPRTISQGKTTNMAASDYEVFDERFRDCVNRTSHVERLWTGA